MKYVLCAVCGYLLGCSSMAFYLGRMKRVDLQASGSGNLGASNTTLLLGWGAGILVALHDIGKAALAVFLAAYLFPDAGYAGVIAGLACVLGHMFPFYLGFRGGKGLASYWGMTLILNWKLALAIALLVFVITLATDYIFLGTLGAVTAVPTAVGWFTRDWLVVGMLAAVSAVIFYKHRDNVRRMMKGEEAGLRSAIRGEKRIG